MGDIFEQFASRFKSWGTEDSFEPVDFQWKPWLQAHIQEREIKIDSLTDNLDDLADEAGKMYEALGKLTPTCPKEVRRDLALLVLYDLVMLLDDSTTMKYEEEEERRIGTLVRVLQGVCEVYGHANPTGVVSVKFLNFPKGRKNVTSSKLKFMDSHRWGGVTRIGSELKRKILDSFVYSRERKMEKPLLVITITDGEIEGEQAGLLEHTVINCIQICDKHPDKGRGAVSFTFAQVGNDKKAARLLRNLSTDPKTKEYVDCLLESTLESIDTEGLKWDVLPQLMLGAITERWSKHYVPVLSIDENNPDRISDPDQDPGEYGIIEQEPDSDAE
ncbi:hypothetical protein BDD12DRAFT_913926 [Trichophaea hybrida]|nr:hypothetical protein BDD12DRAFT_913926 [Trichophaea hybrida]